MKESAQGAFHSLVFDDFRRGILCQTCQQRDRERYARRNQNAQQHSGSATSPDTETTTELEMQKLSPPPESQIYSAPTSPEHDKPLSPKEIESEVDALLKNRDGPDPADLLEGGGTLQEEDPMEVAQAFEPPYQQARPFEVPPLAEYPQAAMLEPSAVVDDTEITEAPFGVQVDFEWEDTDRPGFDSPQGQMFDTADFLSKDENLDQSSLSTAFDGFEQISGR